MPCIGTMMFFGCIFMVIWSWWNTEKVWKQKYHISAISLMVSECCPSIPVNNRYLQGWSGGLQRALKIYIIEAFWQVCFPKSSKKLGHHYERGDFKLSPITWCNLMFQVLQLRHDICNIRTKSWYNISVHVQHKEDLLGKEFEKGK